MENPVHLTGAVKFISHPIRALPVLGVRGSSLLGLSGQVLAAGAHPTPQLGALGTSLGWGQAKVWTYRWRQGTWVLETGPAVVLGQGADGHGRLA